MTTTQTISREQLLSDIAHAEEKAATLCGPCADDHARLAGYMRMLLEAMDSEPVYQVFDESGGWFDIEESDVAQEADGGNQVRTLYAAPPAPVAVPDELLHMAADAIEDLLKNGNSDSSAAVWFDMPGKLRAAMLKAGPVTAATWIDEAKKLAEMYGTSFVAFRNGEEPQCADPTKVVISFTDKGLGYPAAPEQEV